MSVTIAPTTLDDTWWRMPVLIASAAANAWAEEVVMVGYLLTRLRQLGWSENRSLAAQAVLRGSYHLYQGLGGFVGNIVMGLVFGRVWQRQPAVDAGRRAHADRRGGLPRLRRAARPRRLAALSGLPADAQPKAATTSAAVAR